MAETVVLRSSATTTPTVGTENFLDSININGVFQLIIDLNAMAAGDILEIRLYRIVLTGGTVRKAELLGRLTDAQPADQLMFESDLYGNDITDTNSLRFSILQTSGVGRAFPWKVLQY